MSPPSSDGLKLGHTAELNADVVADNIRHLCHAAKGGAQGVATGLATYPFGAVGASKTPRVSCVSLGEVYGVLSFNGLVIDGALAAVVKALLEWTKIAACAERPVGVAFWKFGDAAANWISRTILSPPTKPAVRLTFHWIVGARLLAVAASPAKAATQLRTLVTDDGGRTVPSDVAKLLLQAEAPESDTFLKSLEPKVPYNWAQWLGGLGPPLDSLMPVRPVESTLRLLVDVLYK